MISQEEAERRGLGFPRGCALAVVYVSIVALAILFLLSVMHTGWTLF